MSEFHETTNEDKGKGIKVTRAVHVTLKTPRYWAIGRIIKNHLSLLLTNISLCTFCCGLLFPYIIRSTENVSFINYMVLFAKLINIYYVVNFKIKVYIQRLAICIFFNDLQMFISINYQIYFTKRKDQSHLFYITFSNYVDR